MATKATKTTTTTRRSAPKAKAAPAAKPAAPAAPAASTVKRTARSTRDSVMSTVASVIDANPIGKAVKVTRKVSRAVVKTRRASLLSKAIRNKVVVVTGATAGIGEDAAIKLAKAGAIVILAARTPEKLDATMAKIKADAARGNNRNGH